MRSATHTSVPPDTGRHAAWRGALRRHLAVLLLAKLAALVLLWALFFSPGHRPGADAAALARALLPAKEASHD